MGSEIDLKARKLADRIAHHWHLTAAPEAKTSARLKSMKEDARRKLPLALKGKNIDTITPDELARRYFTAMMVQDLGENHRSQPWPLDSEWVSERSRKSAYRLLKCISSALSEVRGKRSTMAVPESILPVWRLTLPFITHKDCDLNAWANPYQWEGTNGWSGSNGNCHTLVITAASERRAREIAAERDCGIWLLPEYAHCTAIASPNEEVIAAECGQAENE